GGAGVLGRLTMDAEALAKVARAALELMHYRNIDAAIAAADPGQLIEQDDARCVKGCYRCLLSYYNQPDHEEIDRTDDPVRLLLLRLARSNVKPAARPANEAEPQTDWHAAVARWGLPAPDADPLTVNGIRGACPQSRKAGRMTPRLRRKRCRETDTRRASHHDRWRDARTSRNTAYGAWWERYRRRRY